MAKKKILIIGGGMSGLISAITAARSGAKVTLLERNNKVGKKLLVTGNGRCNLTNLDISENRFHSSTLNIFESVYKQCDNKITTELLATMGIDLIEGDEGKMYPESLQAASVIKALLYECEHVGVQIEYNSRVKSVEFTDKFIVKTTEEKTYYGNYLIIATGGKSYGDSGSTGDGYRFAKCFHHRVVDQYKSIVQLKSNDSFIKSLKGLKLDVSGLITSNNKVLRKETGEVLFTDYGLSGPIILQLSTEIGQRIDKKEAIKVVLDLVPKETTETLDEKLQKRLHQLSYRQVDEALNGFLNSRLIAPLLKLCFIDSEKKAGDITKKEREVIVKQLKNLEINITDTYLWNQAQVTKGGIDCTEVHADTLESKLQENLFFVGEVLDMDGDCGGFNLQWAISSGYVSATFILES